MFRRLLWIWAIVCGQWMAEGFAATAAEPPASQPSGVLGRLAASMGPGTFGLLNQDGDGSGYGWELLKGGEPGTAPVGSIFAYAQKAVYDPVGDKVYFRGAPHYQGKGLFSDTLICYDVAANRWTKRFPNPVPCGHAYDTNAISPSAREIYASNRLMTNLLRRHNLDSGHWEPMSQPESVGFAIGEASAEYFPERDELLWVQNRLLGAWTRSSDTWKRIAPLPGLHFRSPIARHIPRHRCVVIMGGADTNKKPAEFSHAVYRYDADGQVTRLKDSPPSIKVYISRAVAAVDPVTGDCLFLQAVLGKDINDFTGRFEFWKFDVAADQWTRLNERVVPSPRDWWVEKYAFAVVAAPISKHGVVLFMSAAGPRSKVYLYKGENRGAGAP